MLKPSVHFAIMNSVLAFIDLVNGVISGKFSKFKPDLTHMVPS